MNTTLLSRRATAVLLAAAAAALVAGCAAAPDVRPTLLTLPGTGTLPPGPAAGAGHTLVVGRLDVPEYLVSRRVRYRTDGSTLAEWPDTFWAERIEVGMSREFTSALRARLPNWRICESQCAEWGPAAVLRVVIDRMDYSRTDQRLQASARMVATATGPAPRASSVQRRDYVLRAHTDTPQAQAEAYAELLERLATDAAETVGTVMQARPPVGGAPSNR